MTAASYWKPRRNTLVFVSYSEEGYRRAFDLAPHEFLFHSEGLGWDLSDIVSLFRPSAIPTSIRAFRVGDLFEAIKKAPRDQST